MTLLPTFEAGKDLAIGSRTLFISKNGATDFFEAVPGFLGASRGGLVDLSVSTINRNVTLIDDNLITEFGSMETLLVTPQEMHAFLNNAEKTEGYFFYINHQLLRLVRVKARYRDNGWVFSINKFGESLVLGSEMIVHPKKLASSQFAKDKASEPNLTFVTNVVVTLEGKFDPKVVFKVGSEDLPINFLGDSFLDLVNNPAEELVASQAELSVYGVNKDGLTDEVLKNDLGLEDKIAMTLREMALFLKTCTPEQGVWYRFYLRHNTEITLTVDIFWAVTGPEEPGFAIEAMQHNHTPALEGSLVVIRNFKN